jgi:hypothetical protein
LLVSSHYDTINNEEVLMIIQISDQRLVRRIKSIALRERRKPVEVIAEALKVYEEKAQAVPVTMPFLLAIANLGASGQGDIAERDEEILATEIDRTSGDASLCQ